MIILVSDDYQDVIITCLFSSIRLEEMFQNIKSITSDYTVGNVHWPKDCLIMIKVEWHVIIIG